MLYEVLVFYCSGTSTCSATPLRLVIGERLRFRIPLVRDVYNTVFLGNQIFNRQIVRRIGDLGESIITKVFYDLLELLANDRSQSIGVTQDVEKIRELGNLIRVFWKQFFVLKTCEPIESQLKNSLRLRG